MTDSDDPEHEPPITHPESILPPGIDDWDDESRWRFLQFRLSREEMLGIIAAVVGFESPVEDDRTRLTVRELAAILDETGMVEEWQRQELLERETQAEEES